NMRVLQWIVARTQGLVGAEESVLGFTPAYDDLNWSGLDYSKEEFAALMACEPAELLTECAEQKDYFEKIGDRTPSEFEGFRQDLLLSVS
ncbi:MAG: phosphoenolpyruvate carboxykinase domain-containing protein, partial [Gammaproteobacteria bacterium]|nr:phosphoenolpyruvate carboxykinase domain-containing protein [Gammaproteobacteria bacterium]